MLFVPAVCTLLFYRDKEKSKCAFAQEASYVFDKTLDIYSEYDSAEQNFECTKRPMIMGLWALVALYGKALFAEKIEYLCDLTREAHGILEGEPDFAVIHAPEANILCFRYAPANLPRDMFADFQQTIRDEVKRRGKFFVSKVDLDGAAALRVVMMNHRIEANHFRMLLQEIREVGQAIIAARCHAAASAAE
jgi:L-2,4-diaminobutyrate decarboxylase